MVREDMRLVEIMVQTEPAQERILSLLDDEQLDYTVTDSADKAGSSAIVTLPLPTHTVETVQSQLDELDVNHDAYTVVVNTEAVVSDESVDSWPENDEETITRRRIARDELHSKAANLLPERVTYLLMTALSAVVATAGVLLGSMPVMVGSMVIAPLLGPSMATSAATVISDNELFVRSAKYQALGSVVGLVSALGFALLAKTIAVPSAEMDLQTSLQLSHHTSPTFLLVSVALCAGIAGAISLSTSGMTSLVGVMIAAAVMPPIGVVGVGIAWFRPTVVLGSGAVVLVNMFSINLAAIVGLWYFGYHPEDWTTLRETRSRILKRILVLAALVGALALFLSNVEHSLPVLHLP
ncbi:TIGR00341 family protein [Halorussus halophilus]|uniref:TIGR00341 family protein n=1 Tax=Halorussus halophilus TaxID=2650975 RepID=UPI001787BB63|nr:TIGR00341 family protein [Halorussus halophilus]